MIRFIVAAVLLLLVFGCATVSEEECRNGDWGSVGFQDGIDGRDPDFVENHRRACEHLGVSVDVAEWERGREDGLTVYCSPLRYYLLGRRGMVAKEICPVELQDALVKENRRGLNARLALQDRRRFPFNATPINPGLLRLPRPILNLGNGRSEYSVLDDEIKRLRNQELLWF